MLVAAPPLLLLYCHVPLLLAFPTLLVLVLMLVSFVFCGVDHMLVHLSSILNLSESRENQRTHFGFG